MHCGPLGLQEPQFPQVHYGTGPYHVSPSALWVRAPLFFCLQIAPSAGSLAFPFLHGGCLRNQGPGFGCQQRRASQLTGPDPSSCRLGCWHSGVMSEVPKHVEGGSSEDIGFEEEEEDGTSTGEQSVASRVGGGEGWRSSHKGQRGVRRKRPGAAPCLK